MFKIGMILLVIYTIIYNIIIACQGDYYGTNSTYNDLCFKRNLFAWAPLILVVLIGLGALIFTESFNIFAAFFLLFFSLISSLINSFHAGHKNINTGYQMDMTNSKRFEKEEKDMEYGKAAAIAGSLYNAHHFKEAIKDIENVDGWKEMK